MLGQHACCVAFPEYPPVFRLRLAILFATLLLWGAPVYAVTVAVIRPQKPPAIVAETLARLHGEMLSVGLEVKIVDGPPIRDRGRARAWLEALAAERGASAVIDIVADALPIAVEVWIVDKASGRYQVSVVTPEPDTENISERLAIRAFEVLRSNFAEIDLAARGRLGEPKAQPTAVVSSPEVSKPADRSESVGLEIGGTALTSLDGVGPAILPIVRVGWAVRSWLVMQAALAGLGTRPTVASTAGNARIAQQYGILGGCHRFRADQWLQPFFALSAGLLHTSVEGRADLPKEGHVVDRWSFLLDGSFGAGLRLRDRYYLTVAAHLQVAAPYVAIHIVDDVVASSGRPNLLLSLTLGAWL
jgi:hypothetical protein